MKTTDRLLPFHISVVLTVAGVFTATPRMPQLWDHVDPWLFLVFDGQWVVVDSFYGLLASGIAVWIAVRLLPIAQFPYRLLFAWLPYGVWTLASAAWSRFPGFSLSRWILEILLGLAALILGFALGHSHGRFKRIIGWSIAAVFFYLALRFFLQGEQLTTSGFDVVLGSFWLIAWMPVLLWWLGEKCQQDSGYGPFAAVLLLACLSFYIPQRMFALTLGSLVLGTAMTYGRWGVEPRGSPHWRGYMASLLVFSWWAYISFAQVKPSSSVPGRGRLDGSWYMVFLESERYDIFSYWLQRGLENFWQGVGLGWQLPALAYNRFHQSEMVLPELSYSHGHNLFINIWLQVGLVGLAAYVLWMVAVMLKAVGGFSAQSDAEKRLTITVAGMMLVLLLRNAADDGLREGNIFLFWLLVGFCLGKQAWLRLLRPS